MPDTADNAPNSEHPMVLQARLLETESYQPRWTVLLRPLQTFVSLLPSHKNTRKGRRTARQIKIVVGVLAFLAVVAAESTPIRILGLVALGLAPLVPISQVQKRAWMNRLKNLREPRSRDVKQPAEVTYDGRRVALEREGDKLRRVLVDRGEHDASVGTVGERLYLRVAPESGKKSETVWIGTDDLAPSDLPEAFSVESFSEEAIDRPTVVGGDDWRRLAETLVDIDG